MAQAISNTVKNPGIIGLGGTTAGQGMINLAPVNYGAYQSTSSLPQTPATSVLAAPKTTTPSSTPLSQGSLSLMNPNANFNNTVGRVNGLLTPPKTSTSSAATATPQQTAYTPPAQYNASQGAPLGTGSQNTATVSSTGAATDTSQTQQNQPQAPQQNLALQQQQATLASVIQKLNDAYGVDSPEVAAANAAFESFQTDYKNSMSEIQGRAEPLQFQQGQAGVVQNAYANMFPYYSGKLQAAQTAAGQQLQGLQSAATALEPSNQFTQVPYSNQIINAQGQNVQGGTNGTVLPQSAKDYISSLAQQVKANKMTRADAESRISSYSQPGLQELNNALGAGFSTVANSATVSGIDTTLQSIPQLQAANTAADGIKNTIVSYLSANPDLNASSLAAGNILQQWIQGSQIPDPRYQTLFNYLNEYTNTLAPILGVGGSPTNLKTEIAQGFINAKAQNQTIPQVIQSIGDLATQKIKNLQSGATGGGTVGQGGTSNSGATPMFGSFNGQ